MPAHRSYFKNLVIIGLFLASLQVTAQAPAYLRVGPFAERNRDVIEYMDKQRPAAPTIRTESPGTNSGDRTSGRTLSPYERDQQDKARLSAFGELIDAINNKNYRKVFDDYPDVVIDLPKDLRINDDMRLSYFLAYVRGCVQEKAEKRLSRALMDFGFSIGREQWKKAVVGVAEGLIELNQLATAAELMRQESVLVKSYVTALFRKKEYARLRELDCSLLSDGLFFCKHVQGIAFEQAGDWASARKSFEYSAKYFAPSLLKLYYADLGIIPKEESEKRLQSYSTGTGSDSTELRYARMQFYFTYQQYKEAKKLLSPLLAAYPNDAGLLTMQANIAAAENDQTLALASYKKAYAIWPSNNGVFWPYAGFLEKTKRNVELEQLYREKLNRAGTGKALVAYQLALLHIQQKKVSGETCDLLLTAKKGSINGAAEALEKHCTTLLTQTKTLAQLVAENRMDLAMAKAAADPEVLMKPADSRSYSLLNLLIERKDVAGVMRLLQLGAPVHPINSADPIPLLHAWVNLPVSVSVSIAAKGGLFAQPFNLHHSSTYKLPEVPVKSTTLMMMLYRTLSETMSSYRESRYSGPKRRPDSLMPLLDHLPKDAPVLDGRTLFELAMEQGQFELAGKLAATGHSWHRFSQVRFWWYGSQDEHLAAFNKVVTAVPPTAVDSAGNTFLHLVLLRVSISADNAALLTDAFLKNGYSLKTKNHEGQTPVDMALSNQSILSEKKLKKHFKDLAEK